MVQTSNNLFTSFTQTPLNKNKSIRANLNFSNVPANNAFLSKKIDEKKKTEYDVPTFCKYMALIGIGMLIANYLDLRKVTIENNRSNLYLCNILFVCTSGPLALLAFYKEIKEIVHNIKEKVNSK